MNVAFLRGWVFLLVVVAERLTPGRTWWLNDLPSLTRQRASFSWDASFPNQLSPMRTARRSILFASSLSSLRSNDQAVSFLDHGVDHAPPHARSSPGGPTCSGLG